MKHAMTISHGKLIQRSQTGGANQIVEESTQVGIVHKLLMGLIIALKSTEMGLLSGEKHAMMVRLTFFAEDVMLMERKHY